MTVTLPDDVPYEQMPLFMTELPENCGGNMALDMLQAILEEGTPEERANNFRLRGNESYVLGAPKHVRDAVRFYNRALEQGATDSVLLATILINRAAAHLTLGNWAAARADAERFMEVAPAEGIVESVRIKAHARRARASLRLDDLDTARESIEALRAMLAVSGDAAAPPVLAELLKDFAAMDGPLQRTRDVFCAASEAGRMPLVVRGAEDEMLAAFPDDGTRQHLVETLEGVQRHKNGTLVWPLVLFYPADGQTDVLGAVSEDAAIRDVLRHVLGTAPEWDAARRYADAARLRVFYVSAVPAGVRQNRLFEAQRLIEVRQGTRLSALVRSGHVVAVERGILGLHVLPADAAAVAAFVGRFGDIHTVL